MKSSLVILLPRVNKNSQSVDELLERQNFYASYLRRVSASNYEKPKVLISGSLCSTNYANIEVVTVSASSINLLQFTFKVFSVIKRLKINPNSLIAGTPFQPFLSALLLKLIYPKVKIHTAFHGEIEALSNKNPSNLLKLSFLKLFLKKATTIRFVSNRQCEKVLQVIKLNKTKTFIAPIPYLPKLAKSDIRNTSCVAFVGRIQQERGVEEWIKIAKGLEQAKLLVIGDGPLAAQMQDELSNAIFTGALSNSEVQQKWSEVGVLLSSAPYESYGLALREALLHAIPVVSRRNAGALELQERYPKLISLYTTPQQALQYINDFLNNPVNEKEFKAFQDNFYAEQEKSMLKLAQVWLNEII